ncbi:hypothetical protein AWB80_08156 [Caballeronia pedi]|uniref:Uncharacterized protein n=1 Tax=Caballeronia pedi TaxID=1777141 RepID=A0A158E3U6_9BURK|nr:hypothetical protein [Caballeronia pedi]SAL01571.1 hypothetical protein AWB80_08156 [Caballeronia pedi]
MNTKEIAAAITGATYPLRISKEISAAAQANGIVIVCGESDDNMAFASAIRDEVGCYDGGTAYLTSDGLLTNECDDEDCPHFAKLKEKAATIEALWCEEGDYSWTFKTDIPHETFEIVEDGGPFCRGIVFALKDVPA